MSGERRRVPGLLLAGILLALVGGQVWAAEAAPVEPGNAGQPTSITVGEQVGALLVRAEAKRQSHLYGEALGVLDAAAELLGSGIPTEELTRLRERVAKTAEAVRQERDASPGGAQAEAGLLM